MMITFLQSAKLPLAIAISTALTAHYAIADDAALDASKIERIVVVGEKTEKSLKDTTSSVAVLSEEVLNSTEFKSLTEAIADIPNVVSVAGVLPDIRGVSGNGSAGGFNSISGGAKGRVAILVDGVAQPFVADNTGDSGIWDVQQVEVYRGAQSTSNGRNSIAGAIYIKTKDPTDDWEGAVRVGYRNQAQYLDTAAVVSGPLIDNTLSFRLSAQHLDGETLTDDSGYATNPPTYNLNGIKSTRINAKLKWTPSDKLTFLLSHADNDEKGDIGRSYYKADNIDQFNKLYFRNINNDVATTSLKSNYRINDDMELEILAAVMDYQWGFDSYEPTVADQQQLSFDEKNYTLDSKLSFGKNSRDIFGFIGMAYFQRDHDILSTGAYPYHGDDDSDSLSAYGEVNVVLSDRFTLLTGARFERENQARHFIYGAIDADLDKTTHIFLPKVALQYHASDDTTLALSARQGYNAAGGALNFTAQNYYHYDEEKVTTYELSSRSALADNKVFVSANLFYNRYDGYQALSSSRYITNLDDVATYGAEFSVHANLTEDLELNTAAGLLHSDIKNAGTDYAGVNGNKLNSAPTFTGNLGLTYWLTNELSTAISANYVGEYYGDFENTQAQKAGDYTLVRWKASYKTANWQITGFINNLFDTQAIVNRGAVSRAYPTGYVAVADPRNVGVSVTYSF
ncbi:TonB-dependent receptor [Shewanella sp. YIC-542]|uniref:TonB-dependent receptor n=1 Tax=Shewanella mytili TaxID=3377111 RepID=UPI00398F6870